MPILLTTPYDPGSLDPGRSYTHARINEFRFAIGRFIELRVARGYLDGGVFIEGKAPVEQVVIRDNPKAQTADLSELIAKMPADGEGLYQGVGRVLYEYLLGKGYGGTIE